MLKRILAICLTAALLCSVLPGCGKQNAPEEPASSDDVAPPATQTDAVEWRHDFSYYQPSTIADVVREVTSEDVARGRTYTADDAKVESVIDTIDFALLSEEVRSAFDLDLKTLLPGLVEKLYSDSVVNLAVQALYPLVEKEFAKVWSGLPEKLDLKDVETGVSFAPTANVKAKLYIDDLEKALESIRFYLFPTTLAAHLPAEYDAVIRRLQTATTKSKYHPDSGEMTTPWQDPSILNDEGKLDLPWGVHDRESFIAALSAALSGVEPLLMALLADKPCENRGLIGTGKGHAAVFGGFLRLPMKITSIELVLTASANPGYQNTVAPVFEALDISVPDGSGFASLRDVVETGLVQPIETLMRRLAAAPLDFVLRALPNIAYAVEAQMIVPLLSMLKTEINYTTNAKYTVTFAGDGAMDDAYKSDEPIAINVGEMIDLPSLGIDVSSLNGLLKLAQKPLGASLPELDGAKLATLGTLTWRDTVRKETTYDGGQPGKAAYIQANRADVLVFILEYVLGALKDRTLLSSILNTLGGNEALPELVYAIIDRVAANPRHVIAALVELMVPQDYDEPSSVNWKHAPAPVNTVFALYTEYWTKNKAAYMSDNLPSLVDNVLRMTELNVAGVTADSLSGLLDGLVNMVCNAETLNNLAGKLREALGKVSLPAALAELLKNKLGFDVHHWDAYRADFADGDRAAFKSAFADLLSPVQKVVSLLFSDGDLTVSLTGADGTQRPFLHLHGYDGYAYAVVPLLEALGAQGLPSPAEFKADDSARAFSYLLNALFGVIDGLKADPYGKLASLLPNLILFIRYGGLTSVVDNLLYPVNLALDIVRPVYNLDLFSLVDFDLRFEKTDPIPLLFGLVSGLLEENLGVSVAFDLTTQKLYDALVLGSIETFTSANGAAAYRVRETSDTHKDLLTVVYDYLLKELFFSDNTPTYLNIAKEKLGLSDKVYSYVEKIVPALKSADETYPGSGKALIFWVFFAAEAVMDAGAGSGSSVLSIITTLMGSSNADKRDFASSELKSDFSKPGFSDALKTVLTPLFR